MEPVLNHLKRYLNDTLGFVVKPVPWSGGSRLPFFFRESYTFYEVRLAESLYLLMLDHQGDGRSPSTVRKHMEAVVDRWEGEVIYVSARVTSYNRKRLVEQKIPFVVPGNQLYLPPLGIDFREHFRTPRSETSNTSPSTQALLIHLLLFEGTRAVIPTKMAVLLGYSPMTMTRAFNELESMGLGETASQGRKRYLKLARPQMDTWKRSQSFLRSPVKKTVTVRSQIFHRSSPRAGLTALARYSLLAAPDQEVVALSGRQWKRLEMDVTDEVFPSGESGTQRVEIWSYDPHLFSRDGVVDPLSLYLSLKGIQDERIEAALEELEEGLPW